MNPRKYCCGSLGNAAPRAAPQYANFIPRPEPPALTTKAGYNIRPAARIARESNEFANKLESNHANRFGTWAMPPLPHVDESLKEIEYALDTLKVDGVGVMTSYGDKWLGYREFEPVLTNSIAARPRSTRTRPRPIAASIWRAISTPP